MDKSGTYHDIRSQFWQEHYGRAVSYAEYLEHSDPAKVKRWIEFEQQMPPLEEEQIARLTRSGRILHVLVYSGIWCGDCARQGPMLHRITEACGDRVDLRLIDREASPALKDELRILGGERVPVIVFLSEDFFEVGRFGDRMLSVYRAKAERELGETTEAGLTSPQAEQLASEQEEWVRAFERILLLLRLAPALRARYGD
jgi:hypothetical protein